MQKLTIEIHGLSPLIMHSAATCNPRHRFSKAIASITGKRKKQDEDFEKISVIEWHAGIYADKDPESIDPESGSVIWPHDAKIIIPSENIERMLRDGAAVNKNGKNVQAGCFVERDYDLIFNGPSDINEVAKDDQFIDIRPVKVGQAKVMRCRPIFRKWSAVIDIMAQTDVIEVADVLRAVELGGRLKGLCDYRPKYGRFLVNDYSQSEVAI